MPVTVFVGPSLPAEECRALLPQASLRPPAEQGDLLHACDADGADVLVLVDGTFHQNLSVWHSEVCYLLSRGVTIFGASSMGALRATETETFGMIGVGTIFEWYRDGVVVADDEVALVHGDADSGYRNLSIPLVNIRASLQAAVADQRLGKRSAELVIRSAAALYYPNRHILTIVERCRAAGMSALTARRVTAALGEHLVDQKQLDARACLERVNAFLRGDWQPPQRPKFDFTRSSVFETLYNLDRRVPEHDRIRLQEVGEFAALHHPDHVDIRTAALNRELVVFLGMLIGIKPSPEEISAEALRFRSTQHLATDGDLATWLKANALGETDLGEYLAQEVVCRTLRTWIAFARGFDRGLKPVLDELRRRGVFPLLAEQAAEEKLLAEAFSSRSDYADVDSISSAVLATRHATRGGASITGDARLWAQENGFEGVDDLADGLRRSFIASDVRERVLAHMSRLAMSTDLSAMDGRAPDRWVDRSRSHDLHPKPRAVPDALSTSSDVGEAGIRP